MVREDFFGSGCLDGPPGHRIPLPKAHQPLFWACFPIAPGKQCWWNLERKYFAMETAEQILFVWCAQDWAAEEIRLLYRCFCRRCRLPVRNRKQV